MIINIFLMCSTKKAADAAKNSSDTAITTMHLDQKAWLMFDADYADTLRLHRIEEITVPVQLRNIGKTPARKIDGFVEVDEVPVNDVPKFDYTNPPRPIRLQGGLIYPGFPNTSEAAELTNDRTPVLATPEKRRKFENGKLAFVVWGRIAYEDIFGDGHWIKFCHSITNSPLGKFKACTDQNTIDTVPKPESASTKN